MEASNRKKEWLFIVLLSSVILGFLFWWIYGKETSADYPQWVLFLPYLNALCNSLTTLFLIFGYVAIKKGDKETHIKRMLSAVLTSAVFLVSYLLYHHFHGDTKFLAQGIVRPIYFFILISHIALSIVQLPGILATLYFAAKKNWKVHQKVAKITFPVWLYVSVTGVLIFVFLKAFNT
ncbi:MAG: DUF420 domain-containing protein [Oligoflexia bacterium]|nr:DUF420 domain-containing protein [Oligoflexia bacterium]